jgi:hypothetical protein
MHIQSLRIPALLIALATFTPTEVGAAWVRVNQRGCSYSASATNCGLNEDDRLAHNTVDTLNVYVYDVSASSERYAVACRQSYDSAFVSCGAEDSTSVAGTPGHVMLEPSLSAWSSSYLGTAYIFVNGGFGSMQGYYAAN